jgi:hypothetical protein
MARARTVDILSASVQTRKVQLGADAHAHAKRCREETEGLFRLSLVFCRTSVLRERGWGAPLDLEGVAFAV